MKACPFLIDDIVHFTNKPRRCKYLGHLPRTALLLITTFHSAWHDDIPMPAGYSLHSYTVMPAVALAVIDIAVCCPKDILLGGLVEEDHTKQSRLILQ